jgi:TPR repeat protein
MKRAFKAYQPLLLLMSCSFGCSAGQPKTVSVPDASAGFIKGQAIRCSWGLAEPCKWAGEAYRYGVGVPRDPTLSLKYFDRACSLGAVDACVMVGVAAVDRDDRAHFGDALVGWERACDVGSYWGCYLAGSTLTLDPQRLGIPRDLQRGRAYLAKACSARFLPACYVSAAVVIQLEEKGAYGAAHQQLLDACQLRESDSCDYLARLELAGTFGTRDEHSAGRHFWRACSDGSGESCFALAYLLTKGIGTAADPDAAAKLLSEACRFEYQPACEAVRHPERQLPAP